MNTERWALSRGSEDRSNGITDCILFPNSYMSPIRVRWALKERFQSKGNFWAPEEDFVLDVGHSSNTRWRQSECQDQGRAEWASRSSVRKCWTKTFGYICISGLRKGGVVKANLYMSEDYFILVAIHTGARFRWKHGKPPNKCLAEGLSFIKYGKNGIHDRLRYVQPIKVWTDGEVVGPWCSSERSYHQENHVFCFVFGSNLKLKFPSQR